MSATPSQPWSTGQQPGGPPTPPPGSPQQQTQPPQQQTQQRQQQWPPPQPAPHGGWPAPHQHPPLPVVTTESVPGRTVAAAIGEVMGVAVREREIGRKEDPAIAYPSLLLRSRQEAVARMVESARAAGATAVVGLRFDSSEITQDLSEVVAYGTAVRLA